MDMGLLPEVRRMTYDMGATEALVLTNGDGYYRQNIYGADDLQELCAVATAAAAPHSSITYDSSAAAAATSVAVSVNDCETASSDAVGIRERIVSHPSYHRLLMAYVNCRKVGAPPDVASRLDQLRQDYEVSLQPPSNAADADPELDQFMDAYCQVLHHYHEELSRPFNEAMAFLARVKHQIKDITKDDEEAGEVVEGDEEGGHQQVLGMEDALYGEVGDEDDLREEEEGGSCGEVDYDEMQQGYINDMITESSAAEADTKHIRDQLRNRYKGYIGTLKREFMKKKKKGKLPKDARQCLLEWWNQHYKWPYPSETEKATLAETTGLDQKQINNWFINQRKRHWKPLDDPRYIVPTNGQDHPMQDLDALY